jgi:hypothetical protein
MIGPSEDLLEALVFHQSELSLVLLLKLLVCLHRAVLQILEVLRYLNLLYLVGFRVLLDLLVDEL